MKVCIPVQNNEGINSQVFGHFGSAPYFLVCDTDNMETFVINNQNAHHEHGMCNPIMALNGHQIDAMLVAGMGGNALMKLNMAGVRVFQAKQGTIKDNVELFIKDGLPEFSISHTCAGHGHGGHSGNGEHQCHNN